MPYRFRNSRKESIGELTITSTETLQIKERYLKYEDMRALEHCEKRWELAGSPVKRWELINFIERMLIELKAIGIGYPKILLLRKKQIQRREFDAESAAEKENKCRCASGQAGKASPKTGYLPCDCSAGRLRKEGTSGNWASSLRVRRLCKPVLVANTVSCLVHFHRLSFSSCRAVCFLEPSRRDAY